MCPKLFEIETYHNERREKEGERKPKKSGITTTTTNENLNRILWQWRQEREMAGGRGRNECQTVICSLNRKVKQTDNWHGKKVSQAFSVCILIAIFHQNYMQPPRTYVTIFGQHLHNATHILPDHSERVYQICESVQINLHRIIWNFSAILLFFFCFQCEI